MKRNACVYIFISLLVIPVIPIIDCGCDIIWERFSISANCSSRRFINFPCLSHKRLTKIDFTDNNCTMTPKEILSNKFANITHIDLSKNLIRHLPDDLMKYFPKLRFVNFTKNNISDPNELLRLKKGATYDIDDNPFKCNFSDPKMKTVIDHIKYVRNFFFIYN